MCSTIQIFSFGSHRYHNVPSVWPGDTKWRLEARLREHHDACGRRIMEKSAVVEHVWENHCPIN